MGKLMMLLGCLMLAASPLALAADKDKVPSEAQKQQQQRMADCNKQAGSKKLEGDARKKFMSSCLSGDAAGVPRRNSNSEADCNKQAGARSSGPRKKFMSSCLKG